jgi:hypothetical protein
VEKILDRGALCVIAVTLKIAKWAVIVNLTSDRKCHMADEIEHHSLLAALVKRV